jgi:hypothetical protein
MEKKKIVFFDLKAKNNDFEFWMNKSPLERIYALEHLRNQYLTNNNGIRQRLQRVLSITKSK